MAHAGERPGGDEQQEDREPVSAQRDEEVLEGTGQQGEREDRAEGEREGGVDEDQRVVDQDQEGRDGHAQQRGGAEALAGVGPGEQEEAVHDHGAEGGRPCAGDDREDDQGQDDERHVDLARHPQQREDADEHRGDDRHVQAGDGEDVVDAGGLELVDDELLAAAHTGARAAEAVLLPHFAVQEAGGGGQAVAQAERDAAEERGLRVGHRVLDHVQDAVAQVEGEFDDAGAAPRLAALGRDDPQRRLSAGRLEDAHQPEDVVVRHELARVEPAGIGRAAGKGQLALDLHVPAV